MEIDVEGGSHEAEACHWLVSFYTNYLVPVDLGHWRRLSDSTCARSLARLQTERTRSNWSLSSSGPAG